VAAGVPELQSPGRMLSLTFQLSWAEAQPLYEGNILSAQPCELLEQGRNSIVAFAVIGKLVERGNLRPPARKGRCAPSIQLFFSLWTIWTRTV
jgi:hypothetical protein